MGWARLNAFAKVHSFQRCFLISDGFPAVATAFGTCFPRRMCAHMPDRCSHSAPAWTTACLVLRGEFLSYFQTALIIRIYSCRFISNASKRALHTAPVIIDYPCVVGNLHSGSNVFTLRMYPVERGWDSAEDVVWWAELKLGLSVKKRSMPRFIGPKCRNHYYKKLVTICSLMKNKFLNS